MITGAVKVTHLIDNMDPFQAAIGPNAMQLGYLLTGGFVFPFLDGAYIIRRRRLYPAPGPWVECGIRPISGTTEITNFPGFDHDADMGYQYQAAVANGVGYRSDWTEPLRFDFDGAGDLITPFLPAWPTDVWAEAVAGGVFRIHWRYETFGQGAEPTDFSVHVGVTPETIIYVAATGTVDYVPGVQEYAFDTSPFADGLSRAFAVRARNSGAVAEQNELTTKAVIARATAPTAGTILRMSQQDRRYGR